MNIKNRIRHNTSLAHIGSLSTYPILSPLGEFDMFLAPLIIRDRKYANFCKKQSLNRYTILDSGVLELVAGTESIEVKDHDLLEIAFSFGFHEIVCPDVPNDPKASYLRTKEFIENMRSSKIKQPLNLMIVPHGKDLQEWFSNALRLISLVDNCAIGIPRILATNCNSDDPCFRVNIAKEMNKKYPNIDIHLLGAGRRFCQELVHISKAAIRSLDSTFIHRYSMSNENPLENYVSPMVLADVNAPHDFANRAICLDKYTKKIVRGNND